MAIELEQKQVLYIEHSTLMTPQIQQAIKLLQCSRMELAQEIQQELEENPFLEATDESTEKDNFDELRELSKYLDSLDSRWRNIIESEVREFPNLENYTTYAQSLTDHLLHQLLMTPPTTAEERIGRVGMENSLAGRIIKNHLKDMEKRNYKNICRNLKESMEDVVAAVKLIQSLESQPGRQFDNANPDYIVPDMFVVKIGKRYEIRLNGSGLPKLRFSSFCKEALANGEKITKDTKEYLKKKMESAKWLIRNFYLRQITIYRVMESILKFQYDFFEKGIPHLKPMVLREVADDLGLHESTVSRINETKYVQTPRGIFSLKYFFPEGNRGRSW